MVLTIDIEIQYRVLNGVDGASSQPSVAVWETAAPKTQQIGQQGQTVHEMEQSISIYVVGNLGNQALPIQMQRHFR